MKASPKAMALSSDRCIAETVSSPCTSSTQPCLFIFNRLPWDDEGNNQTLDISDDADKSNGVEVG